jgi:hypothetical protein
MVPVRPFQPQVSRTNKIEYDTSLVGQVVLRHVTLRYDWKFGIDPT